MKKYIGTKVIQAEPMSVAEYNEKVHPLCYTGECQEGYKVVYEDGYTSWSPKDVFEKAYLNIGDDNKVNEHNVDDFIVSYDCQQWGDKTTIVNATLANGFIITESSSCVDPVNFNMDIGERICKEKIRDRVWGMLGFLLQTGLHGLKR